MISRDNFYAELDGSIIKGPESDKIWLREFITDKTVFVGYNTWESIKNFEQLVSKPKKWVIGELTEPCEVHFGGPKSFKKYPPKKLIVHRLRTYQKEGLLFNCSCGLKLLSCEELLDYTEVIYEKRW